MMSPDQRRYQLLIVEDEPTDALLLLKALKCHLAEARIEHATTGADALKYLKRGEASADRNGDGLPQLILTDLKLPGISGFELLATVKSTDYLKEIPIVVLTSSSESRDVRRAFATGANSYLVKPNTFSDLSALARNIVQYWLTLDQRSAI